MKSAGANGIAGKPKNSNKAFVFQKKSGSGA